MGNRIFQFALERRCTLQWKDIEGLNIENAMRCMQDANAAHGRSMELAQRLSLMLHPYGASADSATRRAALSLRRDVHNQRNRPNLLNGDQPHQFDTETTATLGQWVAARNEADSLSAAARAAFDTGLVGARRVIARLVLNDDAFSCGLQTANRRIYDQAEDYAHAVVAQRPLDKKLRNTEDRLVSYLYKVVAKPTPFASFAEIVVRTAPGLPAFTRARREVRVARDVLLWLQAQCIDHFPGLAHHLPLRLNNTLQVGADRVELFARGRDGTPAMLSMERFVELKRAAALDLVLDACRQVPHSIATLTEAFTAQGLAADQAHAYLDTLVRVGVLELDFGIPDQESDFAGRAAGILSRLPERSGQPFATLFARVAQLEQALGAEHNAKARRPLLDAMAACLADFAAALGTDPEPLRNVRDLFFEDVGTTDSDNAPAPLGSDAECDALASLSPLLMLFDAQLTSRLSVATLFRERYGAGATVALLDFYKDYRATPKEELFARLTPAGDASIAAVINLRRRFCSQVREALVAGQEIDLASPGFAGLIADLPTWMDSRSVSMFVQRIGAAGASLVLNSASTGFCSAMSRFAHLFDGAAGTLAQALAAHLEAMPGGGAAHDIGAVLAANSNLHPPLLAREIVYPGSQARSDAVAVSLRQLQLADRDGQLVLQRADTGEPVDLMSQNFIHPAAGPALYRFLHLFSSHWVYRSHDLLRALIVPGQHLMPRVRFGPVVLCRQTWPVAAGRIQSITAGAGMEFDTLLALDAWRVAAGLPRRVFYRAVIQAAPPTDLTDIKQVMALRQGRLRKPHMLDFQNPFLVRIFLKQAATLEAGDVVHFQEMLPDTCDDPDAGPVHELLIQVERGH